MDFGLSEEQKLIVETTRAFVENELYPHEAAIERSGELPLELVREIQTKAIELGLYAANIPEEFGGAGLDTVSWMLYEKELGRANYALHWTCVARPSNILCAGTPAQREKYLAPCVRGEKWDCLAMSEPGAGSDLRGMKASAVRDGDDWVLNGTKHFISHADIADFAICFMATGEEETPRGRKKLITAFFVDKGTPGFAVRDGYRNVSHRGYTNAILEFDNCRLPQEAVLGEVHKGFEVANLWLGATRLQVAATCLGRAERAFAHATEWAASRAQFGQPIGRFQGVSFKLADMATEMKAAELMTLEAGWKADQGTVTDIHAVFHSRSELHRILTKPAIARHRDHLAPLVRPLFLRGGPDTKRCRERKADGPKIAGHQHALLCLGFKISAE